MKVKEVSLPAGRYVIAVSGGVDSVALLAVLIRQPHLELVIAHFDHGMRPDSAADARFVAGLAEKYGLRFAQEQGRLGPGASEEAARIARYAFLRRVKKDYNAQAILTAHHQDDLLETIVINLLRGTGWRGLCSLRDTLEIRRPFLRLSKEWISTYAHQRGLVWREDPTNQDTRYLRNKVRHQILAEASEDTKRQLLALAARQEEIYDEVESTLRQAVPPNKRRAITFPRTWLIMLPNKVGEEVLRAAAIAVSGKSVERPMLARMLWFAKTALRRKVLQASAVLALEIVRSTVVVRRR